MGIFNNDLLKGFNARQAQKGNKNPFSGAAAERARNGKQQKQQQAQKRKPKLVASW